MTEGKNIYQRMTTAMRVVKYIQKDKPSGLQYSIVSHDKVTAAVRPALLAEGIYYYPHSIEHTQNGNRTEVSLTVRFVNVDKPEDFFDVPSLGYGLDTQDKGPGKAVSYAVKYALLKAMGLETGDDHVETAPDGSVVPSLADALVSCHEAVEAIKQGLATQEMGLASEAWFELTDGEKSALWVAPSKGGPFTTQEREVIKSTEFREANGAFA